MAFFENFCLQKNIVDTLVDTHDSSSAKAPSKKSETSKKSP